VPLKAVTNHVTRRRISTVVAAAVLAASAGCGAGSNRRSQSAADFIHQVTVQFSRGQAGPLWDSLHPADQAVVGRARYEACQSNIGFDLKRFKVLQTYADTVNVGGKETPSTAVSVQVTSDDGVTTATMHSVSVNGKWRWILTPVDYRAYRQGRCPSFGS
jgi:hypothetical protein